jgi:hypothetical protein
MDQNLSVRVQDIVRLATELKNKHTDQANAKVNYACIFCQRKEEYDQLLKETQKIGKVVKSTSSGLLFKIPSINTVSGKLQLLKIRIPDPTRPEKGDADFTVLDYKTFKKTYLSQKGFKLFQKEGFEMIELMEPACKVRAYFSYPPLDKQLGIQ